MHVLNLALFFIFSAATVCAKAQPGQITSVSIKAVDPMLQMIVHVDCGTYESSFDSSQFKCCTVSDSSYLKRLTALMKSIVFERNGQGVDARFKFHIQFANGADSIICMDRFLFLEVNGRPIKKNTALSKLLGEMLAVGCQWKWKNWKYQDFIK